MKKLEYLISYWAPRCGFITHVNFCVLACLQTKRHMGVTVATLINTGKINMSLALVYWGSLSGHVFILFLYSYCNLLFFNTFPPTERDLITASFTFAHLVKLGSSRCMKTSSYVALWLLITLQMPSWLFYLLAFIISLWSTPEGHQNTLEKRWDEVMRSWMFPPLSFIWNLHAANKLREPGNNRKACFFCHLTPTKYFTDTDNWIVIGFLCVVNEMRLGEVDSKWSRGWVCENEG